MKARRPKQASRSRVSIDDAFHRLLPTLGPHGAVERMNAALRDPKRARLWCNGAAVDPGFIQTHLVVRARLLAKHQWTAEIEATRALKEPVGSYRWKVVLLPTTNDKPPRKGSRTHQEIRQFAGKEFGEWKTVPTHVIMKAAGKDEEFKRRVRPFPHRSTWERALGRKKD